MSALELTGQLPLVDVFNRVLRSRSRYQLEFRQKAKNVPAPLEQEPPPQPASAGEEQSMQPLIDFWENAFNKFHNISRDKISQLLSPLYCLEERQVQFLTTEQASNAER